VSNPGETDLWTRIHSAGFNLSARAHCSSMPHREVLATDSVENVSSPPWMPAELYEFNGSPVVDDHRRPHSFRR
jgi:hypothetical protein